MVLTAIAMGMLTEGLKALLPGLASKWTAVSPSSWRFDLRTDAKFHDGTPFTAADVVFTYGRAPNVPNAPSSAPK